MNEQNEEWVREHLEAAIGRRLAEIREAVFVVALGLDTSPAAVGRAARAALEALRRPPQ
jgi:hypothetical protein